VTDHSVAPERGDASGHDDVWVIVPCYNEGSVIGGVLKEITAGLPNVVCVDDGSSDETVHVIRDSPAHLIRHPINLGQGAALQTGLTYALAQPGSRYFITFDADGQHRAEDAVRMVELAKSGTCDVVLGSRFLGQAESVPRVKRLVLRAAATMSVSSRRLRLSDAHNGLRVFNRDAAAALQITQNGMAHAQEIVTQLSNSQFRVTEAPVTIIYTEYSQAKGQSLVNGVNILFDLSIRHRRR
jgi:polyprenyl-phospho-N-acetylgalactosaminyl synthase